MRGGVAVTDEPLLNVAEAAAMLRMSRKFVYEQVAVGVIPHIKLGRFYRFRRADIDAWLEASTRSLANRP